MMLVSPRSAGRPAAASSVAPVASGYERSLRPCSEPPIAPRRRSPIPIRVLRLFARAAAWADDHVQVPAVPSARERLRGDAELLREAQCELLRPGREVHRRLPVVEAVGAVDLDDAVREAADPAGDTARDRKSVV